MALIMRIPFRIKSNKANLVQPWDLESGFRGFGFKKTWDVLGKLTFKPNNKVRVNYSYWQVENHQKIFSPSFMFWNDGQTELFQDTYRHYLEYNQSVTSRTFFTVRTTRFIQDRFLGVRWQDSDDDGRQIGMNGAMKQDRIEIRQILIILIWCRIQFQQMEIHCFTL